MSISLAFGSGTKHENGTGGGSSTFVYSFTGANIPAVGEDVVVNVSCYYGSTVPTIADNQGTTGSWFKEKQSDGIGGSSNNITQTWKLRVTATSDPFTITLTGGSGSYWSGSFDRWAGLANAAADASGKNSPGAGGSLTVTAAGATSQADELVIAVACNNTVGVVSLDVDPPLIVGGGSAYTILFKELDGSNYEIGVGCYRIVSATLTPDIVFDFNSATALTGHIVTFKAATGSTVAPGQGTAVISGLAPTVVVSDHKTATPTQGTAVISGLAPTVSVSNSLTATPDVGTVAIQGFAPTVVRGTVIPVPVGSIVVSGKTPTLPTGITIDGTSAGTSIHPTDSYESANVVYFIPRLTAVEGGGNAYENVVGAIGNANGKRPFFNVPLAGASAAHTPAGADETWFYSYDRLTWTPFDGTPDYSSGTAVVFRNSTAFTQDTVWVARDPREGVYAIQDWYNTIASTYPTLIHQVGSGVDGVVDTFSAQTDELGRTVASTPVFAWWIARSAPNGSKRVLCFFGGLHASEDRATTAFKRGMDYLLGQSTLALRTILDLFDVLVIPLANAPGREGGHYRNSFEAAKDPNRHYTEATPGLETVTKTRAILDTYFTPVGGFTDWHGGIGTSNPTMWGYGSDASNHPPLNDGFLSSWNSRAGAFGESVSDIGDELDGINVYTTSRAYLTYGSPLSITLEFNSQIAKTDADMTNRGRSVLNTFYDRIAAGDWGPFTQPGQGTVVIQGFAPTVVVTNNVVATPGVGSIVASGLAPSANLGGSQTTQPDQGAVVIQGFAPTVSQTGAVEVLPAQGAVVIQGFAPSLALSNSASPGVGAAVIQGFAPVALVSAVHVISVPAGSIVCSGLTPSLATSGVNVGCGSIAITGFAPTVLVPQKYARLIKPAILRNVARKRPANLSTTKREPSL